MKKTYRSFFCLLAVLLLSVSALPAASALFSERLYYYGTVEEISRAADGTVESVLVTAEGQETYEMVITERTQWQDHDEETTSDPVTLAVGEQICVVHDPDVYKRQLFNRALQGLYTPGSTFKPAVAVAALDSGLINQYSTVFCNGVYTFYKGYSPRCTRHGHSGNIDVVTAIKWSCNVFFYDVGRRLTSDVYDAYAYKPVSYTHLTTPAA